MRSFLVKAELSHYGILQIYCAYEVLTVAKVHNANTRSS